MKRTTLMTLAAACTLSFAGLSTAYAEETVGEKVKEGWEDTKKNAKQTWRNAKGELCEMVDGKAQCMAKRAKYKTQNAVDEVKDKAGVKQ